MEQIKKAIAEHFKLADYGQALTHKDAIMEDSEMLSTYKLYSDATIYHFILDKEIELLENGLKI